MHNIREWALELDRNKMLSGQKSKKVNKNESGDMYYVQYVSYAAVCDEVLAIRFE